MQQPSAADGACLLIDGTDAHRNVGRIRDFSLVAMLQKRLCIDCTTLPLCDIIQNTEFGRRQMHRISKINEIIPARCFL